MARIPFVTPNDVPADERPAFDRFVQNRGSVPNVGPYALLAYNMNAYELQAPANAKKKRCRCRRSTCLRP